MNAAATGKGARPRVRVGPWSAIHNSACLYTIRVTYTRFGSAIHNSRSAIHNSTELYTIRVTYTQFRRSYTQFGLPIHNSRSAIHNSGSAIPDTGVRGRFGARSARCVRTCEFGVIEPPGRSPERLNRSPTPSRADSSAALPRCGAPRRVHLYTIPVELYTIPAELYTIRFSYTQFASSIHNSADLYTIRGAYTQFRAAARSRPRTPGGPSAARRSRRRAPGPRRRGSGFRRGWRTVFRPRSAAPPRGPGTARATRRTPRSPDLPDPDDSMSRPRARIRPLPR